MLGSFRRLRPSALSAYILSFAFNYGMFMGIIFFDVKANRVDGCLIARSRYWYKGFCLIVRLVVCIFYCYSGIQYICSLDDSHFMFLAASRLICCLICGIAIMVLQFWYGQQVLRVVNRYLRLFRRVRALPGCQAMGFGSHRELTLLLFKLICLAYEFSCELPSLFSKFEWEYTLMILADMYTSISAAMISHISFVGFLSVGALYAQVNRYVRRELRRQLRGLEQPNGRHATRRALKAADYRLDECVAIYEEIQRVGTSFQKLIEIPLSLILLFAFLAMTMLSYFIMLNGYQDLDLGLLVTKMLLDVVLLTLAIHGAGTNSRIIRRLSLENCYVSERRDWHMRLEMFLNRLNFYEFRVCPLGLFEISNELILVFLSGLVTYLTYILQYGIQSNQI